MRRRPFFFFTFGILSALALVACGGNVVVDTPGQGGDGAGAQGTAGSVGTGMGGTFGATTVVGSTGTGMSMSACQSGACSGDSAGACACTGTCSDGDTAAVSCPGGGATCTCSLSGPGTSSVASCDPATAGGDNPCDFVTGCCASFF